MLNFLVDYADPTGADCHIAFQSNARPEQRRLVAKEIIRYLKAQGCTPKVIARLPGDYTPEELEHVGKYGPPASLLPLSGTYEFIS
jgi:hypothetical protein